MRERKGDGEGRETEKTESNPCILRVLEEESYAKAEITTRIEVRARGRGSNLYN